MDTKILDATVLMTEKLAIDGERIDLHHGDSHLHGVIRMLLNTAVPRETHVEAVNTWAMNSLKGVELRSTRHEAICEIGIWLQTRGLVVDH